MKKSLLTRLGAGALILTLVSTVLLSGTLAKYTSTVNGSATGTAATWKFGAEFGNEGTTTIALGDYLTTKQGIKSGVIAPGSSGTFNIIVDGAGSDVGMKYNITLSDAFKIGATDGNSALPEGLKFKYTLENGTETDVVLDTAFGSTIAYADTTVEGQMNAMKKTVTIKYDWELGEATEGQTAIDDTSLQGKNFKLDIKIVADQIAPTAAAQ